MVYYRNLEQVSLGQPQGRPMDATQPGKEQLTERHLARYLAQHLQRPTLGRLQHTNVGSRANALAHRTQNLVAGAGGAGGGVGGGGSAIGGGGGEGSEGVGPLVSGGTDETTAGKGGGDAALGWPRSRPATARGGAIFK